jgi:hypothetical protein
MTITVVTRWTTPNVAESTQVAKKSKSVWTRHGAVDVRLNQIHTGPSSGEWLFIVVFADWAAYAGALAAVAQDPDFPKLIAANAKIGAKMHEREILVGTDI